MIKASPSDDLLFPDAPAVHLRRVSHRYGARDSLRDLDLTVPRGRIFGLLGPNGAGKTTTIRILLGHLCPAGGDCAVLGMELPREAEPVRRRIGACLENRGFYERLSVVENLEFYARIWGFSAPERKGRIEELLRQGELESRRNDPVQALSNGMKQRLAILRSLIHRPELLFLDEPTASLDPVWAEQVRQDLRALAADGKMTIFLTTHLLHEAEDLCAEVAILHQGRILAQGPPRELASRDGVRWVIRGSGFPAGLDLRSGDGRPVVYERNAGGLIVHLEDGAPVEGILRALLDSGARIDDVEKQRCSLEEVFIRLVKENP